ncbi:unnamed protein product [Blepharisma stoltei]|uniref:Uncharacterized protein n=1 Tax=Blepharisma stoltei TaxID=1481888 RepID=A0AAU9JPC9_9CILI|nr:unnamed protein product [Blepharisma stoltei]
MCLITQNPELCNHQECLYFYSGFAQGLLSYTQSSEIDRACSIVNSQNTMLHMIINKNLETEIILNKVHCEVQQLSLFLSNPRHSEIIVEQSYDSSEVFQLLRSRWDFQYTLQLESELPLTLYKERGFSLAVSLRNSSNENVFLKNHTRCKVLLFTSDDEPKLLKCNIRGKKILRGTTEAEMSEPGIVKFENMVINEVSSHYTNEVFLLAVICLSSGDIKPLVIENLNVKARTMQKKKQKLVKN